MSHEAYTREVPGSRVAVVMIHGILGTPDHFVPFMDTIPESFSIYNLLLDGHGGNEKDFANTSMKKWHDQLNRFWEVTLFRYDRVYIIAHSMGTLFALRAAMEFPDNIAGLFLLSVPLCPFVRPRAWLASFRLALGHYSDRHIMEQEMLADSGVRLTKKLWRYILWIPRFLELFREIDEVKKLLPRLTVPTLAYQSRVDELVAFSAAKHLAGHKAIRLTILEHSGHFAYRGADVTLLKKDLTAFLQ